MVELLTTITIMGILMAVGISAVFIYLEKSRYQAMETIASTAYDGMIMYMMDNNVLVNQGESYPTSADSDTKIPRVLGGTKELLAISLDKLYKDDLIERPTNPYDNSKMCTGGVYVKNNTDDANVGLENYNYIIYVYCGKGHELLIGKEGETTVSEPDLSAPDIRANPSSSVWTQSKNLKLKIIVSDDSGLSKNVGVQYYWQNIETNATSEKYTYAYKNKKGETKVSFQVPKDNIPEDTGKYRLIIEPWISSQSVGVEDVLGNVLTTSVTKEKFLIDNTKPTCGKVTGGKTTWTDSDLTVTQACEDSESGCVDKEVSKKFTSSTKTHKFTIVDNAGNKNTCTVDVYLDKKAPSCGKITGQSKTWTGNDRTISVKCNDNSGGSGCKQASFEKTFSSTTKVGEIVIEDKVGHTITCKVNAYVDKTNPTNPKGGNIGAVSGSNPSASIKTGVNGSTDSHSGFKRYLYLVTNSSSKPDKWNKGFSTSTAFTRSCGTSYYGWAVAEDNVGNRSEVISIGNTKDNPNQYSGWGSCSASCGGGTQTRTNSCALVTTGLSQSCNTFSCCSSTKPGDWTEWSGCSKSCGTGTQTRTRPLYSSYTGQYCKTETGSQNCNTFSCCSSTYAGDWSGWSSCSKSCGGGTQTRTRSLYSNYTGQYCSTETGSQSCNTQTCKPNTPTIYNPTGGNWINRSFSLTVSTTTPSSQIGYWQYRYGSTGWTTYANSATNNFTTTPYSAERNELTYIRVCTPQGNCSDEASTWIRIDKTAPTYTAVRKGCYGYPQGSYVRTYVYLDFADYASGLGERTVSSYTNGRFAANWPAINYGGARNATDYFGTVGYSVGFDHKVCDKAGNCNSYYLPVAHSC